MQRRPTILEGSWFGAAVGTVLILGFFVRVAWEGATGPLPESKKWLMPLLYGGIVVVVVAGWVFDAD